MTRTTCFWKTLGCLQHFGCFDPDMALRKASLQSHQSAMHLTHKPSQPIRKLNLKNDENGPKANPRNPVDQSKNPQKNIWKYNQVLPRAKNVLPPGSVTRSLFPAPGNDLASAMVHSSHGKADWLYRRNEDVLAMHVITLLISVDRFISIHIDLYRFTI